MPKFNTGNPVGSSDPRDLYDTAAVADNLVTGSEQTYPDRLGRSRRSWQSVEDQVNQQEVEFNADQSYRANTFQAAQDAREGVFNAYLVSAGYQFAGDYAAGIEITQYNQVVRDNSGEFWRVSGSVTLPYTTTGAGLPEGGNFVAVGDAALRQELDLNLINLLGYYNVRSYGAVGDGVADDRAAIQAAVDSASAADGGVVFLPAGTYRITGQINWKTKVSLKGMGAGISIIKMDGVRFDAIRNTDGGTEGGDESITPLDDCHFEDFEIDGSGLTDPAASVLGKGIFINFMRRAVFRNLYIHHTIGTGLGCDFHKDTVIDSCVVSYCGRNFGNGSVAIGQSGIGIGTGWGEDDYLTISNCFTNYNGNYGIFLERQGGTDTTSPYARGTRVVNCYSKGNRIGIGNRFSGGMTITGCQAIENTLNNYRISNTLHDYNTLTNCRSERSGGDGFHLENTSAYTKISSCISVDDAGRGFHVTGTSSSTDIPGGIGIHLADCSAFNSSSHGISIAYGPLAIQGGSVISGCHVVGAAGNGVNASRVHNLSIKSSIITQSGGNGVTVQASPDGSIATISGCDIVDNALRGVYYVAPGGAEAFTLRGCTVVNNNSKSGGGAATQVELTSTQATSFLLDSNTIGGSTDSADFETGIKTTFTDPDVSILVTNNDLRHNSVRGFSEVGIGTVVARNNAGYNYRPLSAIAVGASPSSVGPEEYDAMYYINADAATATVEGGSSTSGGSLSIFVPAGLGLTIEHTGLINVRRQRL